MDRFFDRPWRRDWLFWLAVVVSVGGAGVGFALGETQWWEALSSAFGGVFLIGLVGSVLREGVRGFRSTDPS